MIGLIRADDIDRWASRITSVPEFPRLVRRLVHFTARGLRQVDFPADESVRLAGWDGKVLADEPSAFVPDGFSAWELGTGREPRAKANEDYDKRTDNPVGVEPLRSTFVFVTPRRWPGKEEWAVEKRGEGKWKNVIALDAENLAQWLESAPGVAAWFGPVVGCVPPDARGLEAVCEAFKSATQPPLDIAGLLVGRDLECAKLLSLLQGPPVAFQISATTASEVAAFVGACIESLPEYEREPYWGRAVWIDSNAGLRALSASERPLIVVSPSELAGAGNQHHHIKAFAGPSSGGANSVELGAQPISALVEYLAKQGLDRNDAYQRCQEAGGYLERLRHTLLIVPSLTPKWATPAVSVSVAAAILLGEWDESYEADKQVVAQVAGVDYEQFIRALTPFQTGPTPLINHAGKVWKVYSRSTAWKQLEPSLTALQFEAFRKAAVEVLTEADPRFELAPDERWMADVHRKRRAHSNHLRNGLAGGLCHAAALGRDDSACYAGHRVQSWIDSVCRQIFEKLPEPGFWRRIRGELQELAEAAPDPFLAALETDLGTQHPQILDLFEEEGEHSGCLHADLLWALELLAWAPQYVGRAALVLAALASRDPGGRWSNRPHASLSQILLPAQPQCSASAAERKQLRALIMKRFPEEGWKLGKSLMPAQSTIITFTARPKLRTWAPAKERSAVLVADYWAEIQDISECLVEHAGKDVGRWHFLLSNLNSFTPPFKERVLRGVEETGHAMEGTGRLACWKKLRKLLHHHNQFSQHDKVEWVYSREILDRIEALYTALTPVDTIDQVSWLFDFQVERPINVAGDWRVEQERTEAAQAEAIEVLSKLGAAALVAAIPRFENHRLLGYSLGRSSVGKDLEASLLPRCAGSANEQERDVARGFATARHQADAERFLRDWCSRGSGHFISEEAAATIMQGLPASPQVWDSVESVGALCHRAYWREAYIHLSKCPAEAERAARNYIAVGRALAAIDVLALNANTAWLSSEGDTQLVIEALEAGVAEANAEPGQGQRVAYHAAQLIKSLADSKRVDTGALMHLEWMYYAVLEYQGQHDLVIHQHLMADPELLLRLIGLLYIPEGESREGRPEPSEAEGAMASHAWHVLNDWKPFGKMPAANMPSPDELAAIVERVRAFAAEKRHSGIVDDHLGKAMATSPAGTDGVWPHESIRDVLERYDSKALADGFVCGKHNLRGTTSRSPGDGGDQERQLAAEFDGWQRALAITHPRTSALLGRLAEDYRSEANREDVDVRRR